MNVKGNQVGMFYVWKKMESEKERSNCRAKRKREKKKARGLKTNPRGEGRILLCL